MDKRCQLIYPYVSDHIYEFPTVMQCAKKCCDDIENNFTNKGLTNVSQFTLKNIDSKKLYTFNLNFPLTKKNKEHDILLTGDIEHSKIQFLEEKITKLENEITQIKQFIILEQKKKQIFEYQQNHNECTIQ